MRISLVHATWKSKVPPSKIRDLWLDKANNPGDVEYCVAMDSDDIVAEENSRGLSRSINSPDPLYSTSVRNWNAAARLSTGDLLFTISDDLEPPVDWDLWLIRAVGILDPLSHSFVVKIQDSPWATDTLCRHPVVSRAWYQEYGLFDPRFHGVYCDTDLTLRAYKHAFIVDGRSLLKVVHKNPLVDEGFEKSKSHSRQNSSEAYKHAEMIFNSIWPDESKPKHVSLVKPSQIIASFRRYGLFRKTIVLLENLLARAGFYSAAGKSLVILRLWLGKSSLGERILFVYKLLAKK